MKTSDIISTNGVDTIIKFLHTAPEDELFTIKELSEQFNVPESTIKSSRRLSLYKEYYLQSVYFGSIPALVKFRKSIDDES